MGETSALGGVEEQVQLFGSRQTPAGALGGGTVSIEQPQSLLRSGSVQESGEVETEKADADVVPVDEPRARDVVQRAHEDVLGPEVTVQQRFRTGLLHRPDAPWRVLAKVLQLLQEALSGSGEGWWRFTRCSCQGFERGDGVAQIRREKVGSLVARAPPDLGQERVALRTRVELGDEIDRGCQMLRLPVYGECFFAEILVHVPDPAPVP